MKLNKYYSLIFFFILSIAACSPSSSSPSGGASLTIVNVLNGSTGLVTNFTISKGKLTDTLMWYNTALQIPYGSYSEISSYLGTTPLSISDITDTLHNIFNGTLNLPMGSIHSLFISGQFAIGGSVVDTLFTTDKVPYYPATGDSLTGIRFINLVSSSNPVLVTLQSDTTHTPLLQGLGYRSISDFLSLPATIDPLNNGYNFEFRDAVSDSILTTYSLYFLPFKSQTLAFCGTANIGFFVSEINNY